MKVLIKHLILLVLLTTLTGCLGSSGGDSSGGEEGPPPSGGQPPTQPPVDPDPDPDTIEASDIKAGDDVVLSVTQLLQSETTALIISLIVNDPDVGERRVIGLTPSQFLFTLARLEANPGDSQGTSWRSYILRQEDPICRSQEDVDDSNNGCTTFTAELAPENIPDSAKKVQDELATGKVSLSQAAGENNGILAQLDSGEWQYTYDAVLADPEGDDRVHRACFQLSLNVPVANQCVDFVPAIALSSGNGTTGSSLEDDFYQSHHARNIVTEQSCNSCHDNLAFHGGRRTATDYCVTCHNPDTYDANSGELLDFKRMVHRLHNGRELPSNVDDGIPYVIWGYRNHKIDYSNTSYPQNITSCGNCHAGEESIEFASVQNSAHPRAVVTLDGHLWVSAPTKVACESCHEKLFTDNLKLSGETSGRDHTSYNDEANCAGCHRDRGAEEPGSLQANQAHRDFADDLGRNLTLSITSISQAKSGEQPSVVFNVKDLNGDKIDLLDPVQMCADASFTVRVAHDAARDYRGNINASGGVSDLTAVGDNDFRIDIARDVPASVNTVAAMLDFNFPYNCDPALATVRLDAVIEYQASSSLVTNPRRAIVAAQSCNDCHDRILTTNQYHRGTRAVNNPEACVACHGSEFATSDRSREFGLLVHGIHASAIRNVPHKDWTEDKLQYPGDIANCENCHVNESFTLPLPLSRDPIKVTSDSYSSAQAASCSSCHDSDVSKAHMVSAGNAKFNVSFDEAGGTLELCSGCHSRGGEADVAVVHKK